jgi:hypothetical protein
MYLIGKHYFRTVLEGIMRNGLLYSSDWGLQPLDPH